MKPSVARNLEAHRTVLLVSCPHCGQGVGQTCVTSGTRENEAQFPHSKRVHKRWLELSEG